MRMPGGAVPGPGAPTSTLDIATPRSYPARITVTQALVAIAAAVVVVAALHFGRSLLMPIALAGIFSFLLAPLVTRLHRWGLGRFPSVLVTVGLASAVVAVIAIVVVYQVINLAESLPQYQSNIERKIQAVKDAPAGPVNRLRALFTSLEKTVSAPPAEPPPPAPVAPEPAAPAVAGEPAPDAAPDKPAPPALTPMGVLRYVLGSTLGPLASAAIVFVLVIFMLVERGEIRARLLRLLGSRPGQLYVSTQALDDASSRVSRYLLMQLVVNGTYGVPIYIGLFFIGVPSPFLWALLTVVLRFIPYAGPLIGAALPLALTLAVDPGWSMFLWTAGLFIVVELISNNILEPLLYGRSTGITPLGIILSAVFWAWVWGPIGLLMATPMTVCLVVLGQYIPAMGLFPLLLGDRPALPLYARIYQRLLAMDADEPDELSRTYLSDHSLEQYYGEVLVPLLRVMETERRFHALEPTHREFILERIGDLISDMAERPEHVPPDAPGPSDEGAAHEAAPEGAAAVKGTEVSPAPPPAQAPAPHAPPRVLNLPSENESDELVARMLAVLLQRRGIPAQTSAVRASLGAQDNGSEDSRPDVICISALPPSMAVRVRRQIARARAYAPNAPILVGHWSAEDAGADFGRKLGAGAAVPVVATLGQAIEHVLALARPQA